MEDCTKCSQTIANCECHIPDEEKHAGLYNLLKLSKGDYARLAADIHLRTKRNASKKN